MGWPAIHGPSAHVFLSICWNVAVSAANELANEEEEAAGKARMQGVNGFGSGLVIYIHDGFLVRKLELQSPRPLLVTYAQR